MMLLNITELSVSTEHYSCIELSVTFTEYNNLARDVLTQVPVNTCIVTDEIIRPTIQPGCFVNNRSRNWNFIFDFLLFLHSFTWSIIDCCMYSNIQACQSQSRSHESFFLPTWAHESLIVLFSLTDAMITIWEHQFSDCIFGEISSIRIETLGEKYIQNR